MAKSWKHGSSRWNHLNASWKHESFEMKINSIHLENMDPQDEFTSIHLENMNLQDEITSIHLENMNLWDEINSIHLENMDPQDEITSIHLWTTQSCYMCYKIDFVLKVEPWNGLSHIYVTERKPTRSKINNLDLAKSTAVLGPQKFIAYTEDLAELIDEYCLNHHMYADDTQMIKQTTVPGIPGTIMKLQSCIEATQEMVQIATTSTESSKNRTDLVRVKGQSKEDGRSWLELVHWSWCYKAGQCRSWLWGLSRQWTVHASIILTLSSAVVFFILGV